MRRHRAHADHYIYSKLTYGLPRYNAEYTTLEGEHMRKAGAIPNYIPPVRAQYPFGTLRTVTTAIGALAY